jgi:hypothetical protein
MMKTPCPRSQPLPCRRGFSFFAAPGCPPRHRSRGSYLLFAPCPEECCRIEQARQDEMLGLSEARRLR